jgi:HK97 family phage major capsid protein
MQPQLLVALVALALVIWFLTQIAPTSFTGGFGSRIRFVLGNLNERGEVLLKDRRETLKEQQESFVKVAREIAAKAEGENRDFTPDERTAVTKALEDAKGVNQQIKALDGDSSLLAEINALGQPVGDLATGGGITPGKGKSAGERFTTAPQFKDWLKTVAPSGQSTGLSRVGHSPAVEFGGIKDLLTGVADTSAGALIRPDWLGLIDEGTWRRPLVIRNLVTNGQTGTDTIEYARETTVTIGAAPVPEATSELPISDVDPQPAGTTSSVLGGVKPKSHFELEMVRETVKTIAHWLPATKRALSDAAQIRTLIDNFLRYGLEEELEDQIVSGAGAGEDFMGILHVPGTQGQVWDTDLLVTTRKAKTKIRTVGRATATAYVFNPEDNERIDLMKDGVQRFYGNGPFGVGPDVLWGIPRIESEAVPAGTGIVADWRKAILWDREQAALQISDSHEDFFVRNLVAILSEMRAAFGIVRPKAFNIIDLTA